jgi:hypothetical protein
MAGIRVIYLELELTSQLPALTVVSLERALGVRHGFATGWTVARLRWSNVTVHLLDVMTLLTALLVDARNETTHPELHKKPLKCLALWLLLFLDNRVNHFVERVLRCLCLLYHIGKI